MVKAVGRYAPSPSGPLHFGSLIAAVASFCHARGQGGQWLLRIDDLDRSRVVPGADRAIAATLAEFGLHHDAGIVYQSDRAAAYAKTIASLQNRKIAFDCGCTRREAQTGPQGIEGPIYPGTCRNGLPAGRRARSVRLRVASGPVALIDRFQGQYSQDLAADIGDFVIRRADGITAYQLATVVDDAAQGVTEVVRGADLLSSTPRQLWIHRCLDWPEPCYGHVPILVDSAGKKLSKSTGALALESSSRQAQLVECLQLLGQGPPESLGSRSVQGVIRWALDNWEPGDVPVGIRCRRYNATVG